MDEYSLIYEMRKQIDLKRQPSWQKVFDLFASILERDGLLHPYGPRSCAALTVQPAYAAGAKGISALLTGTHCYRITSVRNVIRGTTPLLFEPFDSDVHNWALIKQDFDLEKDWVPLSNYCGGHLSGPRQFTWWTPLPLAGSLLVQQAHRLGIPNDFIAEYDLILRCSRSWLETQRLINIPTIIDAFDSIIFCASNESGGTTFGVTIDIDGPMPSIGVEEAVAPPIPVAQIQAIPVYVSPTRRKDNPVWLVHVLAALRKYYEHELAS